MYPILASMPYDSPWKLFQVLPKEGIVFLDSTNASTEQGRYSFIGVSPFMSLKVQGHQVFLNEKKINTCPFELLQSLLLQYQQPHLANLPPFQGGIAGMFGYELAQYLEKIPAFAIDDLQFPELLLGLYDLVYAWDHHTQQAWIFSSGFPEKMEPQRAQRAQERLLWAQSWLSCPTLASQMNEPCVQDAAIESMFSSEGYQTFVQKVKEYILAGDIFEANISQRFKAVLPTGLTAVKLFERLRQNNPAPFSAYLQWQDNFIASASPERFLKCQQNQIEARPIKGTRPRDLENIIQDKAFAQELLDSEKDRAENIMIVDLMRNDLSKVAQPFSVKVPQLCKVESFATVHHLVSVVTATLKPKATLIDLVKAAFPGGSITGAPKIRSMEIIAECEPVRRGPYCGSMGYIGFNNVLDLSITIRTFVIKGSLVTFHVGGAVTMDSIPEEEYRETLAKGAALRYVLTHAQRQQQKESVDVE